MQPKVLNLIHKFENLSNEISKPRRFPVTRQKSVPAPVPVKEEEPPRTQTPTPTPTPVQGGWQNKPMVVIEEGLRAFKKKMESLDPADEKSVLVMFMDILDLLIQLSSIDTDGLKSMKVKKENCLLELKKCKNELTELVVSNKPVESENQVEVVAPHNADQSAIGSESEEEEEDADELEELESFLVKPGVVQSLTRRFEQDSLPETQTSPVLIRKGSANFLNLENSEEDSEDESDTSQRTSIPKMSLPDIYSELDYFKDIVPSLDAEDFVKIESVEEQLEMLLASSRVHNCDQSQLEIADLLNHVKALKNGEVSDVSTAQAVTSDVNINTEEIKAQNMPLIDQQTLSQDFIESEQRCVFIKTEHAQQIPHEQQVDDENYPSIQVVDINIPGDEHLTASYVMLNTYKDIMKEYLQAPKEKLMNMEGAILKNFDVINAFVAHPNVEPQFAELRSSYKVLLDFITEERFSQLYSENIDDANGEMNGDTDLHNVTHFHNLCAEISNYYPFIEKVNTEEPMQLQVLRENLVELSADIRKFDVSFNEDLKLKQVDALKELDILLKKIGS